MEINEKVQYWIQLADYDLSAAKAMLESKHYLYGGFMCHQSIEKSLKAVVTQETNEVPLKTHNLIKLYEKTSVQYKLSENQIDFIDELNPLNIETRYPEYKESLTQTLTAEYCNTLLKGTEDLLCWIKKQLSPPQSITPTK